MPFRHGEEEVVAEEEEETEEEHGSGTMAFVLTAVAPLCMMDSGSWRLDENGMVLLELAADQRELEELEQWP